jgi:hypothetical protein
VKARRVRHEFKGFCYEVSEFSFLFLPFYISQMIRLGSHSNVHCTTRNFHVLSQLQRESKKKHSGRGRNKETNMNRTKE